MPALDVTRLQILHLTKDYVKKIYNIMLNKIKKISKGIYILCVTAIILIAVYNFINSTLHPEQENPQTEEAYNLIFKNARINTPTQYENKSYAKTSTTIKSRNKITVDLSDLQTHK